MVIFTRKADDNLAGLVKAVDAVQSKNATLGSFVVGVGGVKPADFEKLQGTHKLTTPLTIADDEEGPSRYKLNKQAAVTVIVYRLGGAIARSFAFEDTKSAAEKAKDVAEAAGEALK